MPPNLSCDYVGRERENMDERNQCDEKNKWKNYPLEEQQLRYEFTSLFTS